MNTKLLHSFTSVALLLFCSSVSHAAVTEIFGNSVTDLSGFDNTKGTPGSADASVVNGKLSFNDQSGTDKPEAYHSFTNTVGGLRLDFKVQFNNSAITNLVSDPEIRLRLGNNGLDPTSDAKTGFAMVFRHEDTDSSNQIRAGQWSTNKVSTTSSGLSSYTSVAENTELDISLYINNAYTDQTYNSGANTVAANTYDLYIDGDLKGNYALGETIVGGFDRDVGFGMIGFLGSSDSDQGVDVWFDDIFLRTDADSGMTPVPEPSTFAMLFGAVALAYTVCRRKKQA